MLRVRFWTTSREYECCWFLHYMAYERKGREERKEKGGERNSIKRYESKEGLKDGEKELRI